jgi:hypothetical protein
MPVPIREVLVMALLGQAVLAIWNGIENDAESEFLNWHVHEHIPERVALPGFQRGRRYVAVDGHPKFFNFYEANLTSDFASKDYQEALNSPSVWTSAVVRNFSDTSRTVCEVVKSLGQGEGVFVEAIQLSQADMGEDLLTKLVADTLPALSNMHGVVGVHLLKGQDNLGRQATAETKLRNGPDAKADIILLLELTNIEMLDSLRADSLISDESLKKAGANSEIQRGVYSLQYSLAKHEA